MDKHVNNSGRSAILALSKIGQLRKYLDLVSTQKLIQALVISGLDNNSCVWPFTEIHWNTFIGYKVSKHCRLPDFFYQNVVTLIPSYMISFIEFNILLLTYKAFHIWKISSACMFHPVTFGQVTSVLWVTWSLYMSASIPRSMKSDRAFPNTVICSSHTYPHSPTVAQFKAQLV